MSYGDDSPMDEGIKEYTAGKYSDAISHLGSALNSEFNNAKLHYYMGSCYLKLNEKDAAVREFRIAYALEPTGTPGKYAKQALESMNIDSGHSESTIFSKGLQDQRALSRTIANYGKQLGFASYFYSLPNNYSAGGNYYNPGSQGIQVMPPTIQLPVNPPPATAGGNTNSPNRSKR